LEKGNIGIIGLAEGDFFNPDIQLFHHSNIPDYFQLAVEFRWHEIRG
jgi:hypothetical protein